MASEVRIMVTEGGWRRLKQELADLKRLRATRIAEYAQAKDGNYTDTDEPHRYYQSDIAAIDQRLGELEEMLGRAMVASNLGLAPGTVGVSSQVIVRWEDGKEATFTIVGPPEVNLRLGHISYESPVGRALLGKGQGEWIEVRTPDGIRRLQVLEVSSGDIDLESRDVSSIGM